MPKRSVATPDCYGPVAQTPSAAMEFSVEDAQLREELDGAPLAADVREAEPDEPDVEGDPPEDDEYVPV